MVVVMIVGMLMVMGMLDAQGMELLVGVGMVVLMGMLVGMLVGMGGAVGMGMLVGMLMLVVMGMAASNVIVMKMHKNTPLHFFLLYPHMDAMSKYLFFRKYPPMGLARKGVCGYNLFDIFQEVIPVEESGFPHNHEHEHSHDHEHEHEHQHDHAYLHAHGIPHSHGHVHENQKAVINRLSRAIGHLEKVRKMVEDGQDCSDVLIQLAAVRSALDNTGKVILKDHMRHCMVDAVAAGDQEAIDDLCQAIDKFMK